MFSGEKSEETMMRIYEQSHTCGLKAISQSFNHLFAFLFNTGNMLRPTQPGTSDKRTLCTNGSVDIARISIQGTMFLFAFSVSVPGKKTLS